MSSSSRKIQAKVTKETKKKERKQRHERERVARNTQKHWMASVPFIFFFFFLTHHSFYFVLYITHIFSKC